ncbi:hypothetical protein chiPu_0009436 [Chiloscyllium punctatum]|uniref:Choline transporter-like protein n=1 Tax=Chiloscyllium punctatum TaxID=137246 RepID=A0A401SKR0_CHIPU|nr:hypothetical protein [Chiloscyllium punctatum]
MSCCGQYQVSDEGISHREWRPQIYRRCTDLLWLVIFCLFWGGMIFIAGYSVTVGSAERLIFGYDSFGNICGKKNSPIKGASLSGQDMTTRKHVFFLNTCNLDIKNHKINSLSICVSRCPQEQLNDLEELKHFAQYNGSYLCVYSLNISDYTKPSKAAHLCPQLPVPPSKSFPLFNRCVPQSPACYSHFLTVLINVVKESDFFQRIIGGVMANKEYIVGLCVFAVVLSFIMVALFRFIVTLLVHIFIALVVFGLLFVSGVLWWLYYDNLNDPNIVLETEKENTKALLGFAITATIVSVILVVLTLVMWKRISLTIQLFRVASSLLGSVPLLLFQPLWTFIILTLFWMYWVAVLLSLGTAGNVHVTADNLVEYRPLSGIRYMWWYHVIGLIWTSEFLVACQQITIAGAVVCCYFNRCLVKCCACCLCCLEKWLQLLNQNAYIATAINGTNFCTSAKEAFFLIVNNALNVAAINCFGDFLLFLGKVFVVCFTVFGGLMAFNYNRDLNVWVVPLIMVSFFAYLMAHCFLSVFEMVVDVLFMCYAVDLATNDGSTEKPYFMDKELMEFIGKSNQKYKRIDRNNKDNLENNQNATQLLPMGTNTA